MPYKQGYEPDFRRRLLRKIAILIAKVFRIHGQSQFGNIFLQAVDPYMCVMNPLDSKMTLKFRSGHERLYWRITATLDMEPETNSWIKSFQAGGVFVDIGSNIGLFSLMSAQARQTKCLSFELDPLNASLQHENIFFNGLEGLILLVPLPLSEVTSRKLVYYKQISPGDALHSLDSVSPFISQRNKERVKIGSLLTISLDHLYELYQLPPADYLKIDVDGTELNILRGATRTLSTVKSIMCECTEKTEPGISYFLGQLGFKRNEQYSPSHSQVSFNVLFRRSTQA